MASRRQEDQVLGLWAIHSPAGDRECYNLDVYFDRERGGVYATLQYWKPGALGCESCSSGLVEKYLGAVDPAKPISLSGEIGMTDGTSAPMAIDFAPSGGDAARGTFRDQRGSRQVTYRRVETPPLFVIAPA
jgi:hypothetical protein